MVIKTDWENEEAIAYLQHRFDRMGLDDMLAKAGCKTGDTVRILGYDLDYTGDDDDMFSELNESEPEVFFDDDWDDGDDEVVTVAAIASEAEGMAASNDVVADGAAEASGVVANEE